MNKRRDRNDENNSDISWFQMMTSQLAWQWKKESSPWPQFLWISSKMWKVKEERCPVIFKGYLLKWWCWWIFRTSSKSFDNCWKAGNAVKLENCDWSHETEPILPPESDHITLCAKRLCQSPHEKSLMRKVYVQHCISYPARERKGGIWETVFCSREEASLHVAIYNLVSHLFKVPHACI